MQNSGGGDRYIYIYINRIEGVRIFGDGGMGGGEKSSRSLD